MKNNPNSWWARNSKSLPIKSSSCQFWTDARMAGAENCSTNCWRSSFSKKIRLWPQQRTFSKCFDGSCTARRDQSAREDGTVKTVRVQSEKSGLREDNCKKLCYRNLHIFSAVNREHCDRCEPSRLKGAVAAFLVNPPHSPGCR